ncbi:hypothetical protein [Nocardia asteroides]|uniref:hypothetical protein n=1 Tax=Nocardia asteroides TaxID=1824 RepID=UPI001E4CA44B|nr:hypothetical protein [Nocardia asteroides]UGT56610.1 hypothetical protein LTT85_06990 [Nocardia asteroides]
MLLLTLGGVYDQVMALTENAEYFRSQNYTARQIAYFTDYPLLPAVLWTIGMWGGLVAAVLVLARSRWAFVAVIAGVLGQIGLALVTYGFRDRLDILGTRLALFDLMVFLVSVAFAVYCHRMLRRGVLR